MSAVASTGRPWARAEGVSLHELDALPEAPALRRALADGVARGYDGPLPALPDEARLLLVRAEGAEVGLVAVAPGPGEMAATLLAVAVAHEARGRSLGLRAVLAAERRLSRDGIGELYASVPRGNGRGFGIAELQLNEFERQQRKVLMRGARCRSRPDRRRYVHARHQLVQHGSSRLRLHPRCFQARAQGCRNARGPSHP